MDEVEEIGDVERNGGRERVVEVDVRGEGVGVGMEGKRNEVGVGVEDRGRRVRGGNMVVGKEGEVDVGSGVMVIVGEMVVREKVVDDRVRVVID